MSNNAAVTQTTNIVPVQGIFDPEPTFALISLIGPAGTPFFANISPNQSGLNITNSTINSTTIGATTPSTGAFTSGTVTAAPTGPTDIANKQYVDYYAAGLSWKQPVNAATTANITLSGLQTIDTVSLVAGNTVLVKNQSTAANNGIYVVSSGAWTRSPGADTWDEYVGAIVFVLSGTQGSSAWYSTAQPGGTLGVTAINWSNFAVSSTYTAGTGLTLSSNVFSITPVGTAGTYGSASSVPVFVTNASGQVSSVTNTAIAIANTQVSGLGTMSTQNANSVAITGGTINGATVGGTTAAAVTGTTITANTQFTGAGTGLTGTANSLSIGGNAATATSATTATNLAGGTAGSLPYQSATSTTTFLSAGTNGQVLTLAGGVPSWATPTTGTVTSVGGTGTVSGISLSGTVTTSGNLTLGGTLDLSAPPAIGGTTANTIRGTTVTATTSFVGPFFDAASSAGGALRNQSGTLQLQWGGGGGNNITFDVATNINPANAAVAISPTGTGTVTINPATASSMNNVAIGGTTPLAGTFTDLRVNNTISLAGSTGTAGYVLTSNGAAAPTWQAAAGGLTITDDTTTNATRYLTFTSATTGSITGANVSSTKLSFNPSTGTFSSTVLSAAAGTAAAPSISTAGDTNTGIFFPAADIIAFAEGGTEVMRIDSSGNLLVGTTTATANGGVIQVSNGITFPATQSASTNANTLDDYEEGTWTPTATNFTVSGTSTLTGTYTKIGRVVYFNLAFANTGTIAFDTSAVITLPFTGIDQSGMIAMYVSTAGVSQTSNKSGVQMQIDAANTRFFLGNFTTTSAGETLFFGGFYRVS